MISKKLLTALNDQINYEFFSAYTYLAMAAYAESEDLSGFANFFRVQAREEVFHAMKFYDYVNQMNQKVVLEEIEKPKTNYECIADAFEHGYRHEQTVTERLYKLTDIATDEKEHATISFLKWFIDEQVEEENTFLTIVKKLNRAKANPSTVYMLDDELSTRTFTPPVK